MVGICFGTMDEVVGLEKPQKMRMFSLVVEKISVLPKVNFVKDFFFWALVINCKIHF